MENNILTCQGLSKQYSMKKALDNVTLTLPAGRMVGLLGPNGSGKTTFLKLIAGFLTPSAGEVYVCGKKPGVETIVERVIGKVKNGSIVLFHSGAPDTPTALPRILDQLREKGYEFVTVSSLIYPAPYTLDHEGRQHQDL